MSLIVCYGWNRKKEENMKYRERNFFLFPSIVCLRLNFVLEISRECHIYEFLWFFWQFFRVSIPHQKRAGMYKNALPVTGTFNSQFEVCSCSQLIVLWWKNGDILAGNFDNVSIARGIDSLHKSDKFHRIVAMTSSDFFWGIENVF